MEFLACGVHSPPVKTIRNSPVKPVSKLSVTDLEERLKHRPPGRTAAHLAHLDIGDFPNISPPTTTQELPQLPPAEKFHFRKWIHRTNNSDVALVTLQNDSKLKILKIVMSLTIHDIRNLLIIL
jgi:hypothetical protein